VLSNARELANALVLRCKLNSKSLVLEIASNDGYLLKNYHEKGIPILGVEPARNIARVAIENGVPTVDEFFGIELARKLLGLNKAADVVHAHNVLAHVANLHSVIEGICAILKPDGVAVVENHYVRDLIDHVEFDSIYHEHLCYYSAISFRNLFALHGLVLVDIERLSIHGGSLRVYFQRADGSLSLESKGKERVRSFLEEESACGIDQFAFYEKFGIKVEKMRENLLLLLKKLKAGGKSIAVYGASAKSATLLNYFGIDSGTLDYIVDRSTIKQGRYSPGIHLPIYSPARLLETQPDYVLMLSWNFVEEILLQQTEYRARGGKFIIPIPELKVV
jgi:SAM-dependent methyltransferase